MHAAFLGTQSICSHGTHMKNPCTFLNQADGIAALMSQAERLIKLREILASLLPESLARRCSVANYKQGQVLIFASNSATAAKLKLMLPSLLEEFARRAREVTGLEVAVQAPETWDQVLEKSAKMSAATVSGLAELCEQLPDSELKSAMLRIVFQHRR
jgi:hypothetical protein